MSERSDDAKEKPGLFISEGDSGFQSRLQCLQPGQAITQTQLAGMVAFAGWREPERYKRMNAGDSAGLWEQPHSSLPKGHTVTGLAANWGERRACLSSHDICMLLKYVTLYLKGST